MDTSAVVPMEDAVQALIDHLVYPLLPLRSSSKEPPSLTQQESVAKQVHAVVLLYNYYHRKQFPQLEFLDFESFCKAATIAKATLVMYLKFMRNSPQELRNLDKELSITEKMVMDACKICAPLDASKGFPDSKDWPISKVAIFLADPVKEKCLLQFSAITQGVWSLIEEYVEANFDNSTNVTRMRKNELKNKMTAGISRGDQSSANEDVLQQLAFSVVEQKTGIKKSKLRILEHHLTYSHTEEKRMTQLYIMTYTQTANDDFAEVPINDVMRSLEGPLLKPGLTPELTPVIEYYHLLPYADILSKWLSRETADDGLSDVQKQQADMTDEFEPNTTPNTKDQEVSNKSDKRVDTIDIPSKKIKKAENEAVNKKRSAPSCMTDSSHDIIGPQSKASVSLVDANRPSKGQYHTMKIRVSLSSKKDGMKEEVVDSEETMVSPRPSKSDGSSVRHPQQQLPNEENTKNLENVISTKSVINVARGGPKDNRGQVDDVKRRSDEGSLGRSGRTDDRDHEIPGEVSIIRTDLPLPAPAQCNLKKYNSFQLVTTPKRHGLLEVSLLVLQRKREAMCKHLRLLEDEIAQCEMKMQTIINEVEKEDSPNSDLIIEASDLLCSSELHMDNSPSCEGRSANEPIKRKRLCEAILSLKSACQELDDVCTENNWMLPRYSVLPSSTNGKFQANVMVQGFDFECSSGGELRISPREARESAATHLLSKLRSMASQAQ